MRRDPKKPLREQFAEDLLPLSVSRLALVAIVLLVFLSYAALRNLKEFSCELNGPLPEWTQLDVAAERALRKDKYPMAIAELPIRPCLDMLR